MSTVLVTGASSGFGRLLTETLARGGHEVIASMRESEGRNASVRSELDVLDRVRVVEMDIGDDASVEAGVRAAQAGGPIDVAVNNAGVVFAGLLETVTVDQARDQFETNVFGALRVNRAVLPAMRERGSGLLMHVSSMVGRAIFPFVGIYAASKHALEAIAEGYRYELAPLGVDSVVIEPGMYDTGLASKTALGEDAARAEGYGELATGMERLFSADTLPMGSPQEVADAMVELLEMPFGSRPLRTPVGADTQPLAALNELTDRIQAGLLESVGVGELLQGREAPSSP